MALVRFIRQLLCPFTVWFHGNICSHMSWYVLAQHDVNCNEFEMEKAVAVIQMISEWLDGYRPEYIFASLSTEVLDGLLVASWPCQLCTWWSCAATVYTCAQHGTLSACFA